MEHNGFEYVDFGLPSGTLWATMNVGADAPTDDGLYFQWHCCVGYTANDMLNGVKSFDWKDDNMFNFGEYSINNDAAHIYMGGNWRMPTKDECKELLAFSSQPSFSNDCVVLTCKNDSTKELIFPLSGYLNVGKVNGYRREAWMQTQSNKYHSMTIKYYTEKPTISFGTACEYFGNVIRGVFTK